MNKKEVKMPLYLILEQLLDEGHKSVGTRKSFDDFATNLINSSNSINIPNGLVNLTNEHINLTKQYRSDLKDIINSVHNNNMKLKVAYRQAKTLIQTNFLKSGLMGSKSIAPTIYNKGLFDSDKKFYKRAANGEYTLFRDVIKKASIPKGSPDRVSKKYLNYRAENFGASLPSVFTAGVIFALPDDVLIYWVRRARESCIGGDAIIFGSFGVSRIDSLPKDITDKSTICGGIENKNGFVIKKRGKKDTIRVCTALGYNISATPDHLFMIYDKTNRKASFRKANDLKNNDYLMLKKNFLTHINPNNSANHIFKCVALGYSYGNKYLPKKYKLNYMPNKLYSNINDALVSLELPYVHKKRLECGTLEYTFDFVNTKNSSEKYELNSYRPNIFNFLNDRNSVIAFVCGFFLRNQDYLTKGFLNTKSKDSRAIVGFIQTLLLSIGTTFEIERNHINNTVYSGFISNKEHSDMIVMLNNLIKIVGESEIQVNEIEEKIKIGRKNNIKFGDIILDDDYIAVSMTNKVASKIKMNVYDIMDMPYEVFLANGMIVHNCKDCIALEAGNPYTPRGARRLYTTPRAGDTICFMNCKCKLKISKNTTIQPSPYDNEIFIGSEEAQTFTDKQKQDIFNKYDDSKFHKYIPIADATLKDPYEINFKNKNYTGFYTGKTLDDEYATFDTTQGKVIGIVSAFMLFQILHPKNTKLPKKIDSLVDLPEIIKDILARDKTLIQQFSYYQQEGEKAGYEYYDLYAWVEFLKKYKKDENNIWIER